MQITLVRSLCPDSPNQPIENIKTGKITYIGQILKQLKYKTFNALGHQVYTVNDIKGINLEPPFMTRCGKFHVQTDLTTHIINTPKENEYRITKLLAEHNITVTFIN